MNKRSVALLVSFLFVFACGAFADTLITKDGKVFEGRLVQQTDEKVIFEMHRFGAKVTKTFDADEVLSITKGKLKSTTTPAKPEAKTLKPGELPAAPAAPAVVKYDGPTYYVIPLHGEVGKALAADVLAKSLADAQKRKATVVVLEVDSPGGTLSEADKLIDTIRRYDDRLRIVVFVRKKAISAAAIMSLAVRNIYMNPSGIMGAATAYRVGPAGFPAEIEEKMQSIWRATARSSAETGGHNPLLAEAMIDSKLELHVVEQSGKKVIKEGHGSKMVIKKGRLLTMTATEAMACGLSAGTAEDYDQLGKLLGHEKWTECTGLGRALAEHWTKTIEKVEVDFKKLKVQFEDNMRLARENDPTRYTYQIWSHNKKFTPVSKRKWQSRSAACSQFLHKAEQSLQKCTKLAKDFPQLDLADPDGLLRVQKEIALIRTRIAKGIYRKSPVVD